MDTKPSSVSELFPSRWLRAEDLGDKSFILTISDVTIETVNDKFSRKEMEKGVVWFEGAKKGLVLNITQANEIARLVGSEQFRFWRGHKVMLRKGMARNNKPTIIISEAKDKMV